MNHCEGAARRTFDRIFDRKRTVGGSRLGLAVVDMTWHPMHGELLMPLDVSCYRNLSAGLMILMAHSVQGSGHKNVLYLPFNDEKITVYQLMTCKSESRV